MNGDQYARAQDDLYVKKFDPWENFDGLRCNIYSQYHKIITSLILPRYKTVVDIGCGVGGLVNLINMTTGFRAAGIDTSRHAIAVARERFPWDYEIGDIRYWKPAVKVDMVLSTGPYYHLLPEERRVVLRHIGSYLNDGGAFLIAHGGDINMDGDRKAYPDLSDEIFSEFKKQQYVRYMYKDGSQNGSWVFYVGEK